MSAIVIIGAGECGVRAAFALREQGFEGTVTLLSGETHLPYERPPLSKAEQNGPRPIRPIEAYQDVNIDLRLGVVVEAIEPKMRHVVCADGAILGYDRLLIATGARSRLFPGMERALTLRTAEDARAIFDRLEAGRRLAVIGGGFIGLELAAVASRIGAKVTVLEAAPRLMARAVPEAIAEIVAARHRAAGVDLRLNTGVREVLPEAILLADGSQIEIDLVVAGVGAVPNTELAERAGIDVQNGIRVDNRFRTSIDGIFAAGDCCSFPHKGGFQRLESWRAAQEQGAHAAACMIERAEDFTCVPWFWSDQYELSLQVAGLMPVDLGQCVQRRLQDGALIEFIFAANGALACAAGVGPGNAVAKDIRLAEMLIARGARPSPLELSNPATNLKSLLKAA